MSSLDSTQVTREKIIEAQAAMPVGEITPARIFKSDAFSEMLGAEIFFCDICSRTQGTGSFKDGGAFNKLRNLYDSGQNERLLVVASEGNHAPGVLAAANYYNAQGANFRVVVHVSEAISDTKKGLIESLLQDRHRLIVGGKGFSEAIRIADNFAQSNDGLIISAFEDPDVIIGQGIMAVDIDREVIRPDTAFCSIGAGGIFASLSAYYHQTPTKVYGSQLANVPAMVKSLANGNGEMESIACEDLRCMERITGRQSRLMVGGITARKSGDFTTSIARQLARPISTATIEQIALCGVLYEKAHKGMDDYCFPERAALTALAGLMRRYHEGHRDFGGKKHVVVLSGGNTCDKEKSELLELGEEVARDSKGKIAEIFTEPTPFYDPRFSKLSRYSLESSDAKAMGI